MKYFIPEAAKAMRHPEIYKQHARLLWVKSGLVVKGPTDLGTQGVYL